MLYHAQYDWMVQWNVMLAVTASYLASLWLLRAWMRSRATAFTLAPLAKVYNATQIAVCAYMVHGFAQANFAWSNPFGLNQRPSAATEWFMLVHYGSKFLDYVDSWLIILKKNDHRQLSFLHVYHHSSIALIWGFLLQFNQAGGTAYFGAAINSVIHLLMYSHYLLASFGIRNPFKRYITTAQMVQFALCLLHALVVLRYEEVLDQRLAFLQFAYHITMLVLFGNFYRENYGKKGDSPSPAVVANGSVRNGRSKSNGTAAATVNGNGKAHSS